MLTQLEWLLVVDRNEGSDGACILTSLGKLGLLVAIVCIFIILMLLMAFIGTKNQMVM